MITYIFIKFVNDKSELGVGITLCNGFLKSVLLFIFYFLVFYYSLSLQIFILKLFSHVSDYLF